MKDKTTGVALITALSILLVVALLVLGTVFTTNIETAVTRNDTTATQANYVARAGLQKYKADLFQYYRWIEENFNQGANPPRTACFSRIGQGLDWDRNASTPVLDWNGNSIVFPQETVRDAYGNPIGSYNVTLFRDLNNNKRYTLQAVGTSSGARSTVRTTFVLDNTGVIEQAIFSGRGQANKFINGGTTIRGGIYVVGDENNPNATVFNSNGNFSLLNDYDLTAGKYSPVTNRVSSGNRKAENLCSTLRVEDGRVELDGSVKLGDPDNKLLGVYIGDEPEDIVVNQTLLECAGSKGICTDDGPDLFDLNNAPDFPHFDDPPSQGCSLATWRDCIRDDASNNGLRVIYKVVGGVPTPQVQVPVGAILSSDFATCLNALKNQEITLDATDIDCTFEYPAGVKQGFEYNAASPGRLEVYGTINLQGYNLTVAREIEYTARTYDSSSSYVQNASIVMETDPTYGGGDIDVNANLLTHTKGSNDQFPDHVLALLAENDVFQDGDFVMAPIYAGNTFRIVKDNTLIGSVVADYFCTTGAGGTTSKQKKQNSVSSSDKCNAGQNSEVVYVNTGNNKPAIMKQIENAGIPVFTILSYEVR